MSRIPTFGLKKGYANFSRMMECQRQKESIEEIESFLFDHTLNTNMPDSTRNFLDKVVKRLDNESRYLAREFRECYRKEKKKNKC